MKTDARVCRTRHLLKEALMKMLQEKSIHDITVKELCELAGVSRATFYKHYRDCLDLMENVENCMLEDYIKSLSHVQDGDLRQLVEAVYELVKNNHGAFQYFIAEQHSGTYYKRLTDLARVPTITCWKKYLKNISESEMDLLFTCLSCGILQTIVKYCDVYDQEMVMNFIESFFHRSITPYL